MEHKPYIKNSKLTNILITVFLVANAVATIGLLLIILSQLGSFIINHPVVWMGLLPLILLNIVCFIFFAMKEAK